MVGEVCDRHPVGGLRAGSPGILYFVGFRYWTASLLPALVGTTLPFWLRPPGFAFNWLGAIEFLMVLQCYNPNNIIKLVIFFLGCHIP